MFDDFIVGPQSDELIPEWLDDYEDTMAAAWDEYVEGEIEDDGFITPVQYLI